MILEYELEEELIEQIQLESEQQIFSNKDIPTSVMLHHDIPSSSNYEYNHVNMSVGKKKNILKDKKISLGINKS